MFLTPYTKADAAKNNRPPSIGKPGGGGGNPLAKSSPVFISNTLINNMIGV